MFGALGGLPINNTAAKAGTGLGDTYTFTGSASYVLSPNFLIDIYAGITTIEVLSEPDRMDEQLGLDFLGIPGTNGPDRVAGGWPHFDITNYSGIGYAGSANSPYVDDNWQVQYTANATYTEGAHTFRFGGDIVKQAMNRHELGNGSGSFVVRRRADGVVRRTVSESVQHVRVVPAWASHRRVERASFRSRTGTREAATGSSASS